MVICLVCSESVLTGELIGLPLVVPQVGREYVFVNRHEDVTVTVTRDKTYRHELIQAARGVIDVRDGARIDRLHGAVELPRTRTELDHRQVVPACLKVEIEGSDPIGPVVVES